MNIADAILLQMQLNSESFRKGLKEASTASKKAKEESVSNLAAIENAAESATKAFQSLALKVTAFFASLLAVNQLKQFAENLTQTDATLGRTARALGIAPGTLSIWEGMGERLGVAASSTAAAFANITDIVARSKLGERPAQLDMMRRMQAEGGVPLGDITNTPQFLKALIANARVIAKKDPARASAMMREAGFPADFVQNVVLSTHSIDDMLAEQEKIGKTTQADADAAQALQFSIVGLQQAVQQIGRDIMTKLSPAVDKILDKWRDWITTNREWIEQKITEKTKEWWGYFTSINWENVSSGITGFIDKANEAAAAMGGWVKLTEALFALWIGGKFIQLMGSISAIYTALTGGAIIGAGGLLSAILAVVAGAALVAAVMPQPLNAGEDELARQKKYGTGRAINSPRSTGGPSSSPTPSQNERAATFGARTQTPGGPGSPISGTGSYGAGSPGMLPVIHGSTVGVDKRLLDSVSAGATHLPPGYKAQIFSGFRPGDSGAHGIGQAIDVQIVDPSGKVIPSRGADATHMYERLARATYGEMGTKYPDLAKDKLAWGGSFGVEKRGGGVSDLMHFDIKGRRGGVHPEHFQQIQELGSLPLVATHPAATAGAGIGHNRLMHRNTKIEHHVDNMTIHSRATDAHGVAHDMRLALRERFGSVA